MESWDWVAFPAPTGTPSRRSQTSKSSPPPTSPRPPRGDFCDRYEIPRAYPSHTALLKDDEVEAVAATLLSGTRHTVQTTGQVIAQKPGWI